MRIVCAVFVGLLTACSASEPPSSSQIKEFTSAMKIWDFDREFGPVYFGSIRKKKTGDLNSCLTLAFMKVEGDRVHYIHKLWPPTGDDCNFGDLSSQVTGLKAAECFRDHDGAPGTRALTPEAVGIARLPGNYYRQLDLREMKAGLLESCAVKAVARATPSTEPPLEGLGAVDVVSVSFGDGSFKMHTRPAIGPEWLYTINMDHVDVFQEPVRYPTGLPE